MAHWFEHAQEVDGSWRRAASSTDTVVPATCGQLEDLAERLRAVVEAWSQACLDDRDERPGAARLPVRVVLRAFPTGPVRP